MGIFLKQSEVKIAQWEFTGLESAWCQVVIMFRVLNASLGGNILKYHRYQNRDFLE